ncbi:hypothetical protein OCK74_19000 [Chitinophagaceae bacterium LB-8]|uniref:Uncharacterized protein n=1 Tax=Paraflavisolibacter caeni TaxID=2982496 RepID=A0A9X2XYL2_9BACT|nr:hypothetical protein [Paraflavisolibacter caeni]MCU7551217.1 hypothetical protein [Paraflavisolibacter caeni]
MVNVWLLVLVFMGFTGKIQGLQTPGLDRMANTFKKQSTTAMIIDIKEPINK